MEPVVPKRQVKHLFYMVGGYTTVIASLNYPAVTLTVASGALVTGLGWWFYPLARAKFTKPIEVVKEPPPVRTANRPKVQDQREAGNVIQLSEEEVNRLGMDPDITHRIPTVAPVDPDATRRIPKIGEAS